MKAIYLLIALVIGASASGCIDDKQTEPSTQAPVPTTREQVSPADTQGPSVPTVQGSPSENDLFGTESELVSVDSLASDLNMDITFSDSI